MNKLMMLVKLDIQTVKPYFNRTNFIIYSIIGLLVGIFSGRNPLIPIAAIMGNASGYITSVFYIGERHSIGILHATFSITRRETVFGRYIYAFIINTLSAVVSFVIVAVVFITLEFAAGHAWDSSILFLIVFLVLINFVQYSVIAAVQMPIYYRGGYAIASKFSSISYVTYLTTLALIVYTVNFGWGWLIENPLMISLIALIIWLIVNVISFFTSCRFYEKRDL